jgi:putative endonuclease
VSRARDLYRRNSKLPVRIGQHKQKLVLGFTQKYNITKLLWCQPHLSTLAAISHEKEIKGWRRSKKVASIEKHNPGWKDLEPPSKERIGQPRHPERSVRSQESLFDRLAGRNSSGKSSAMNERDVSLLRYGAHRDDELAAEQVLVEMIQRLRWM